MQGFPILNAQDRQHDGESDEDLHDVNGYSVNGGSNYPTYDDRIIDVDERRVWLLKVPNFLYDHWTEATVPNTDLGVVRVESKPGEAPQISLSLNTGEPGAENIPKSYKLSYMKNPQSRFVFAENEEGKAVSIAGKIQYEFNVNPEFNDEYRKIMKERSHYGSLPRRTTQFVDESRSTTKFNILAPINEAKLLQRAAKRRTSPDSRKERLPKPELMDLLFRAFEREKYWSLRSLSDYSNQPSVYLKEILGEIADFNTRGPYKGMFQLKAEFSGKK